MRLIDDFLYISTSKEAVSKFLKIMHTSNEEFGFLVNPRKTKTNFKNPRWYNLLFFLFSCFINIQIEKMLSWCGLLFNTKSLEISPDYSRYVGSCMFYLKELKYFCYLFYFFRY